MKLVKAIMQIKNYNSTASESSNYSLYSFEQSLESQIELKEGNSYTSHEAFFIAVKKTLKQLKSQENDFQYEININPEMNELEQAIWMFPEQ
ncbi:9619_t:CDS:2 [Gigaspora margarita]|uniref:9619_t:CDS:1 n=1 Tax=Gigaspora margarita TaxID=4874 RepID=A0ABN7VKS4_GIGMA|nr:9619_t:CDS:2 [Gigaspora margarita]